ncbi:cyclic nucleotide-gated channel alpha-4 [Melopsittacus undulatus]|uniref:cyclic nucleotide-gated channel alpha-4 n=1 Tax=Melopsittacus undulatus TaxID=13146 RepID=UPI00146A7CC8|nr:cyclic nucleotide-gated cation channel alpha-4 [Melopsittacus undulatus]
MGTGCILRHLRCHRRDRCCQGAGGCVTLPWDELGVTAGLQHRYREQEPRPTARDEQHRAPAVPAVAPAASPGVSSSWVGADDGVVKSVTIIGWPLMSFRPPSTPKPHHNWTLDPSGDWYYWWITVMVLPILYNCIVPICRLCFPEVQDQLPGLWLGLDTLSDVLYLGDIGVRLHTAFPEDGLLVRDRSRIRRRYLWSCSFCWDAASSAPLELLWQRPAARATRWLRARRLCEAWQRRETRAAHPGALRVAALLLGAVAALHGLACAYYALSVHLGLGSDAWVCPSGTGTWRRYLHSFYTATLLLATVGDTPTPHRVPELLFATFSFLLGVMAFATITGSIGAVAGATRGAWHRDAAAARRLLGPGELRRRLQRWQPEPALAAQQSTLRALPPVLREELAAAAHLQALSRVGVFQACERGVLRRLGLCLRPQAYGPGQPVCRRGHVGRHMFFIRSGRVAVLGNDGTTPVAVLGQGRYFGELSLIHIPGNRFGNRRSADIVSVGHSELFVLSKQDLLQVLAEFPGARAALEAEGRRLLQLTGLMDTKAEAAAAAAALRAQGLEEALAQLRLRVAALVAQLEATEGHLRLRVQRLEQRLEQRQQQRQQQRRDAVARGAHSGVLRV